MSAIGRHQLFESSRVMTETLILQKKIPATRSTRCRNANASHLAQGRAAMPCRARLVERDRC